MSFIDAFPITSSRKGSKGSTADLRNLGNISLEKQKSLLAVLTSLETKLSVPTPVKGFSGAEPVRPTLVLLPENDALTKPVIKAAKKKEEQVPFVNVAMRKAGAVTKDSDALNSSPYNNGLQGRKSKLTVLLEKIGEAVQRFTSRSTFLSNIHSRGKVEYLGPIELPLRVSHLLELLLTKKELDLLLKKFDNVGDGTVDLVEILVKAKNVYQQKLELEQQHQHQHQHPIHNPMHNKRQPQVGGGGDAMEEPTRQDRRRDSDARLKAQRMEEELNEKIEGKLSKKSLELLRRDNFHSLEKISSTLTTREFQCFLQSIGMAFSNREYRFLERKYTVYCSPGCRDEPLIDFEGFRCELALLGKAVVQRMRQKEAMLTFQDVLSHNDKSGSVKKNSFSLPAIGANRSVHTELAKGANTGGDRDAEKRETGSVAGKSASIPSLPTLANKRVIDKPSVQAAEDWIQDPLQLAFRGR